MFRQGQPDKKLQHHKNPDLPLTNVQMLWPSSVCKERFGQKARSLPLCPGKGSMTEVIKRYFGFSCMSSLGSVSIRGFSSCIHTLWLTNWHASLQRSKQLLLVQRPEHGDGVMGLGHSGAFTRMQLQLWVEKIHFTQCGSDRSDLNMLPAVCWLSGPSGPSVGLQCVEHQLDNSSQGLAMRSPWGSASVRPLLSGNISFPKVL